MYWYPVDVPNFFELYLILLNTITYWLVWLLVTRVRQLLFYSLKAHHPIITTFAHAYTFDHCKDKSHLSKT